MFEKVWTIYWIWLRKWFIVFKLRILINTPCGLGGLVVSALDFQTGYRGFESRSGRDNFQTIITPSSYSTCPGLSIKWTGRRLVIDSGIKCAWVIHESKAVQIHLHHSNRRCLYVPRVPGSVKKPHNNKHTITKGSDPDKTLHHRVSYQGLHCLPLK